MTVNTHVRARGNRKAIAHTERQLSPSLYTMDVKLLRLDYRSSACELRRVPALLVFYTSFGSQNTL
jgi:hypothetical protein